MKIAIRILVSLSFLPLALSLAACGVSGGPIDGTVLEEGTNKPISGAIVVANWIHQQSYSGTVCYHVETTTTDENGKYHIQKWEDPADHRSLSHPYVSIIPYKAGWEWTNQENPEFHLKPFLAGKDERLKELTRLSGVIKCGSSGSSEKNLLPIRRALLAEARELTGTQYNRENIEELLFQLELIEFGYHAAVKREVERIRSGEQ